MATKREKEFVFSDKDFKFISALVGEKTGIVLAAHKKDMVYGRIARRLRVLNLKTFKEYCSLIESSDGEDEISDFLNAVTTNLTKFFREDHHFEHLKKVVFPEKINDKKQGKKLRIWSAGCSSGMEAYSIAMTACDVIDNIASWDIKILATDIDTNVLKKGSEGVYRDDEVSTIPELYKKRYISRYEGKDSKKVVVAEKLRDMVHFKQFNFMDKQWPMRGPFDIIFCRNVVIYFDKATQEILFDKFANLLKPDGWLYIGHSENIMSISDRFRLDGKTIHQRIK